MRVKNENCAVFDEVTGKWYFNPECKLHAGIHIIITVSLICISTTISFAQKLLKMLLEKLLCRR